ncbi:hypothetical protein PG995_008581 [Apiospora arundinis]
MAWLRDRNLAGSLKTRLSSASSFSSLLAFAGLVGHPNIAVGRAGPGVRVVEEKGEAAPDGLVHKLMAGQRLEREVLLGKGLVGEEGLEDIDASLAEVSDSRLSSSGTGALKESNGATTWDEDTQVDEAFQHLGHLGGLEDDVQSVPSAMKMDVVWCGGWQAS